MRPVTHEQFISTVRDLGLKYGKLPVEAAAKVAKAKLLYGIGSAGLRGVTNYGAWQNGSKDELIEICAAGEESWIQLAGTTLHECAHVAAGHMAGHGKGWKEACEALGLRRVHAAGTRYCLASFAPELRMALAAIRHPTDGTPTIGSYGLILRGLLPTFLRPCTAGIGTRGGKSRGVGSGSRLRKYICGHGQIVRAATDELHAHCTHCDTPFTLS